MHYNDNFTTSFSNQEDFLQFLDQIEERADWLRCPTNTIHVIAASEEQETSGKIHAESEAEAEDILKDTCAYTGLLLRIGKDYYPVGSTAVRTLENRARISGYALLELEKRKLARVLNDCLQVTKGQALIRIHEGKVRAVLGGDESDYSILPMPELFETAVTYMEENYDDQKFNGGFFDHSMTAASWEVKDDRLLDTYRDLLLQYGQIADDDLSASIRIHSSDVGSSGANIFCTLLVGRQKVPIVLGGAIKLPHKDNASMEKFSRNLSEIFARYQEEVEGLSRLFTVYVDHPVNVMANVMKKVDISAMLRAKTIEHFAASHGNRRSNGYEVYCGICESIFLAESSGMSPRALVDLEEKVSKCLRYRFHDYDIPGAIHY